jgi:shikimate dehydrogenase
LPGPRSSRRSFKQELVAVFGQPVAENPTQAMIEAAFRHHGLEWRYLTIEVAPEGLPAAVEGARALGFRGFHCTLPHKVAVIPRLDRLGTSAQLIGAVNCVVRRGDELVGENTDGRGFVDSLRQRLDPAGATAVILGAGGAARSIAIELALAGVAHVTIANRAQERGRELASHLEAVAANQDRRVAVRVLPWGDPLTVPECNILVNATSVGLYPDTAARLPIDFDDLSPATLVADVIPNPPRTRFLEAAAQRGCPTIDGLEMLVEQGAVSIRYWTGVEPDRSVMRDSLAAIFDRS